MSDRKPSTTPWMVAAAAVAGWFAFGHPRRQPARASARAGVGAGAGLAPGEGAGRHAAQPTDIPPRGWWMIVKRVVQQAGEDRLMTEAAGVTFYTLLAAFPAIAALISLYGLVADPATVGQQFEQLSGVIPGGGIELIREQAQRLSEQPQGALGIGALVGLGVALWSSNQATKAMFDALNVIYEEKEKRGFIRLTLTSLAVTLGGLVFAVVAMAAVVILPVVLNVIGLGGTVEWVTRLARWPLLAVLIGIVLAALYRFGPSRESARWRWVSWGSGFAAIAWLAGSLGFSWYVENFGSYNETYGSLGAVVGFMTWIWISAAIVLLGGELNAEMEHQTAQDTTTGPEQPLGGRGAEMADHVAPE